MAHFPSALPSRWKMLAIHEGQEAQRNADCEDLAEKQAKPCHFVKGKMTSCHFKANGTLVATSKVRAKELSKVISNNIV